MAQDARDGMGEVYEAENAIHPKDVALNVLVPCAKIRCT